MRMTAALALIRFLRAQHTEIDGEEVPLLAGVFTIYGHGNVNGLGRALQSEDVRLLRGHNEQSMAHAAVAYAKASLRRRFWACTTSIGPGATNLVTAAAAAHVNRLPLLLLPGDVFASRAPDPVLQQLEDFGDGTLSANDCLRPVSRRFDRIHRPEQLLDALPAALRILIDPAECGPVTLALPQDVQAESYDFPDYFFAPRLHLLRRPPPDRDELARAVELLASSRRPLLIAGGGVLYAEASDVLARWVARASIPVAETQAGKGALPGRHPQNVGGIGVTGSEAANTLAREADLIVVVGSRLSDFTTGSRALFADKPILAINVHGADAVKHGAVGLVADAREALMGLQRGLEHYRVALAWSERCQQLRQAWTETVAAVTSPKATISEAQVLAVVERAAGDQGTVVAAAGGLPGELHKLWQASGPGSYHVEYGYSTMGYEIAGGLGVKLARPERTVYVLLGDGSYLMLNSELHTAASLQLQVIVILCDNGGFGCIHRLQTASGGEAHANLLTGPAIDFVAHARALGAFAELVSDLEALRRALEDAQGRAGPTVVVVRTDPDASTAAGGAWWEVPLPDATENKAGEAWAQSLEHQQKRRGPRGGE